jgi:hypothetical protein
MPGRTMASQARIAHRGERRCIVTLSLIQSARTLHATNVCLMTFFLCLSHSPPLGVDVVALRAAERTRARQ